ncbi:MAG: BON domain-containing protein [Gammaproteobacteria bacterium]
MRNIIIILTMALSLQGCIFVVGAAAGAAGVSAVYDHRKIEKILDDQTVTNSIVDRLIADRELNTPTTHIDVTTFNHVVLLTGQTVSPGLRQKADAIAHSVPNVRRVYNEIIVKGPSSSLTRTSDAWITAKIKTQMLATKGLKSGTIKVVTENGTVYLMGIVTHDQADMAVEISRKVSGVQKVVKIFQYNG